MCHIYTIAAKSSGLCIAHVQGMSDLVCMDLVPEPTIVAAALRACRRVNDYSLTTRYRTPSVPCLHTLISAVRERPQFGLSLI